MTLRKLLSVLPVVAACLAWDAGDAAAQARGRASGGGGGAVHAGTAAPRGGAPAPGVGHAVPRPPYGGHYPVYGHPGYPYRPYYGYPYYGYPYYGYGYPYWGYPGFSIGFGIGFGYGYGSYGYGYPAYGYAYPGYTYAAPVYVTAGQGGGSGGGGSQPAYGGLRITGAPSDAQVYADGYFVGAVSDFNGSSQQLNLTAGVHKVEVRVPGVQSIEFDVNVQPGQTITYRAR